MFKSLPGNYGGTRKFVFAVRQIQVFFLLNSG